MEWLLLSSKKEQTSDITESAETQMYSKWKQSNSTGYLDMIPFIRPSGKGKKKKSMDGKQISGGA